MGGGDYCLSAHLQCAIPVIGLLSAGIAAIGHKDKIGTDARVSITLVAT